MTSKTVDSVTTSYGYDLIDQLTQETRTGYNCTYGYDANGNRSWRALNGVMESYNYDDGDKLTHVACTAGSKDYTYDAAGRTTSITTTAGTTSLAYDYEDRVTQITYPNTSTNTFTYNAADTRVGKVDSGGTKTYRRGGIGVTAPVPSDGVSTFTPGISAKTGSASKFLHGDFLGTFSRETDSTQATTATKQHDAFGNLTSSTGTSASPFGFAGGWGYQEDPDSGLKLLGQRYYDHSTGRFLTRDLAKDGRNWYGYCANNPLRWFDDDGCKKKLVLVEGAVGGHLGAIAILYYVIRKLLRDTYGDTYDIIEVRGKSKAEVMEAMANADAIVIYSHGAPGMICLRGAGKGKKADFSQGQEENLQEPDVWDLMDMRAARGKGPLDFVMLLACDTCQDPNWVMAWCMLISQDGFLLGYDGPTCYEGKDGHWHWGEPVRFPGLLPSPRGIRGTPCPGGIVGT